jgi:Mor family transcriptional regulator
MTDWYANRNAKIYAEYLSGQHKTALAEQYRLSVYRIVEILTQMGKKERNARKNTSLPNRA